MCQRALPTRTANAGYKHITHCAHQRGLSTRAAHCQHDARGGGRPTAIETVCSLAPSLLLLRSWQPSDECGLTGQSAGDWGFRTTMPRRLLCQNAAHGLALEPHILGGQCRRRSSRRAHVGAAGGRVWPKLDKRFWQAAGMSAGVVPLPLPTPCVARLCCHMHYLGSRVDGPWGPLSTRRCITKVRAHAIGGITTAAASAQNVGPTLLPMALGWRDDGHCVINPGPLASKGTIFCLTSMAARGDVEFSSFASQSWVECLMALARVLVL